MDLQNADNYDPQSSGTLFKNSIEILNLTIESQQTVSTDKDGRTGRYNP